MKEGHALTKRVTRLVLAILVVIGCAACTEGTAAASRRCTVKVGWYGWEGVIKEDTCANWVAISADCAFSSAGSNWERKPGEYVRVRGWLTFASACEDGKPNVYPFTYLLIHHYRGSWDQVAVDGPFSPDYQVVRSTFTEP